MTNDPTVDFPFLSSFVPRIDKNRHKLILTIFGSYSKGSTERLEKICKFLQSAGYKNAKLVKDYDFPIKENNESDEEWFESKSKFWLNNSDVLFFIFFKDADNTGVGSEFTTFTSNIDRIWRGVVFLEVKDYADSYPISAMISSKIKRFEIQARQFKIKDDEELQNKILGTLPSFMKKLLDQISIR